MMKMSHVYFNITFLFGTILAFALWIPQLSAQQAPAPAPAPAPANRPAATPAPAAQGVPGQAPPATGTAPRQTPPAAEAPAEPETETVIVNPRPGGRRDPFQGLIVTKKAEAQTPTRLPAGQRGLVIGQLQLQGIVRSVDGTWIAVVDNKTRRAYFLRENDAVYNGMVSKIAPDSVTFLENTTDLFGKKVAREVVTRLQAE